MQGVIMCPNNDKEVTLFCKETQCQTLICSECLDKHHLKHEVVDAGENQKKELLDNLTSAVESLSVKQDKITTVLKKNERCLETLKEEKRTVLNLMRDKYDSLIQEADNLTEESRSKMTSLEENLILLNNIKQYINKETVSPREVKNYYEAVNRVTDHKDHVPFELYYVEYTKSKDKEKLVKELCGELSRTNHREESPNQAGSTGTVLVKRSDHLQETSNINEGLEKSETPLAAAGRETFSRSARNAREIEPRTRTIFTLSPKQRVLPRFHRKLH